MGRPLGSRNRPKQDGETAGIGHNSLDRDQLRSVVERIEHLESDKNEIAEDIRSVYAEAKGNGYDLKALRAIVRLRAQDADKRAEHEAMVETYLHALGCLADTPLGQAALHRDTSQERADVAGVYESFPPDA